MIGKSNRYLEVQSNGIELPFIFTERIKSIMENYPANNISYNKPAGKANDIPSRDLNPVASVPAVMKQRSKTSMFLENVASTTIDNLKPRVASLVDEVLTSVIHTIFLGNSRGPSGSNSSSRNYVSYDNMWNNSYKKPQDKDIRRQELYEISRCLDDIHLPLYDNNGRSLRGDAEEVIRQLQEAVYESPENWIFVANFYQMVNYRTIQSDWLYGWNNLDGARVIAKSDGYYFNFPAPIPYREAK